jgi:hypothetical protein
MSRAADCSATLNRHREPYAQGAWARSASEHLAAAPSLARRAAPKTIKTRGKLPADDSLRQAVRQRNQLKMFMMLCAAK